MSRFEIHIEFSEGGADVYVTIETGQNGRNLRLWGIGLRIRTKISILTALLLFSLQSMALSSADSAWFLDSRRTVNYCIVRGENFSASLTSIQETIEWSVAKWSAYLKEMKLDLRPQALTIATQFRQSDSCNGTDLQFYFGVQNAQIEEFKKQDFYHPISFARRTGYDSKAGWGKGLIWVTDEKEFSDMTGKPLAIAWTDLKSLKGILLHEIGHVFGVGHWDGTVMRESIVENLIAKDAYGTTHITNGWELFSPIRSAWQNGSQYDQLGEMSTTVFSRLIGRASQGVIRGQWLVDSERILIEDDLGQYMLSTKFSFVRRNQIPDAAMFYVSRKNESNQIESENENREAFVKIGLLTSLSGEQIHIIVEKNTSERHLKISFQDQAGSSFQDLFSQPCQNVIIPPYYQTPRCLPVYPKDEG